MLVHQRVLLLSLSLSLSMQIYLTLSGDSLWTPSRLHPTPWYLHPNIERKHLRYEHHKQPLTCSRYPLVNVYITMAEITMLLLGKLTKLLGSFSIAMLPSGNQTWHAGKWTIEIGDFPSKKPLLIGNFYWENSPFLLEQLPIDGHFP